MDRKEKIIYVDVDHVEKPAETDSYWKIKRKLQEDSVEDSLAMVVQAYNRIDRVKECVDAIFQYTSHWDFTLYLMDNGSDTEEILQYFQSIPYEKKRIIRYTKNVTGVFAIDYLYREFIREKYLVHVNDDAIVTEHWLDNLMRCMKSNPKIGIVSPVLSNTFYRQEEDLGGFSSLEEMQKKAKEFNQSNPKKWEETMIILPIVALYRRSMLDDVGLYDLGFVFDYGDNDFTLRVRRMGYKLMVCRDTFVHHNHDYQKIPKAKYEQRVIEGKVGHECYIEKYGHAHVNRRAEVYIDDSIKEYEPLDFLSEKLTILFLNPGSGSQILYLKNYLEQTGREIQRIDVVSEEVEYYEDLRGLRIPGKLEIGRREELAVRLRDEDYDIIVENGFLNTIAKPFSYMEILHEKMKPAGIIFYRLENVMNELLFLALLQISVDSGSEVPSLLSFSQILEKIQMLGGKNASLKATQISKKREKALEMTGNYLERCLSEQPSKREEVMNYFLIRYYYITYQK